MKGLITEYKEQFGSATCVFVIREGSPATDLKFGDVMVTQTMGDGELLGLFKIYRNWHIPNG